jgi:hypothetical protein
MPLTTDEQVREDLKTLRVVRAVDRGCGVFDRALQRVMTYVSERLPKKMKRQHRVYWQRPGDGMGSVEYVEARLVGGFVEARLAEGVTGIQIGGVMEVPDDD